MTMKLTANIVKPIVLFLSMFGPVLVYGQVLNPVADQAFEAYNKSFSYRVAGTGGGTVSLKQVDETLATTGLPNTGDWQNWSTVTTTANLKAGTQTFRLYAEKGGWNINGWSAVEGVPAKIEEPDTEPEIIFTPTP